MSATDIEKGSRGLDEIARALEAMKVGIICLTPENLTSEWLHFEAGALSKTPDAKSRVCTYLLAGLESANLKPPLSLFQATKANKTETRDLIRTINKHLDVAPLPEATLNATFEKWWPDLEEKLKALRAPSSAPPPRRTTNEMVAEILDLNRAMIPVIGELSLEASFSRDKREQEAALNEWITKQPTGTVIVNTSTGFAGRTFASMGTLASAKKWPLGPLPAAPLNAAEPKDKPAEPIGTTIAPPITTGGASGLGEPRIDPPKDQK